jgi:hypothetical protein
LLLTAGQGPSELLPPFGELGQQCENVFQLLNTPASGRGSEGAELEVLQHSHEREKPTPLRYVYEAALDNLVGG